MLACPLAGVAQNWIGTNARIDSDGYQSVSFTGVGSRIDTLSVPVRLDGFQAYLRSFFMRKFEGEILRITGSIRTEMPIGGADVTVFLMSNTSQHGNVYSERKRFDDTDWQPFEFEVALTDEVNYCDVMIIINGEGTAWVSDLKMTIDGKPLPEGGDRKPSQISYPADNQPFGGRSGFVTDGKITKRQIENLKSACRAWGEIKYLHPAVARGEHNMDNRLFELLPLVYNARPKELDRILNEWKADFGEYDPLAPLPIYHYYFGTAFANGPATFRHERDYADMDYTDAGLRLLGAFRLWNAVRYFSPYLEHADDQDKVLTEAIENMLSTNDYNSYSKALRIMAAAMNDSHVSVSSNKMDSTIMAAPFRVEKFIDGKFIPTEIFGDNNPLKLGDAITHIAGKTVAEFISDNAWRYSASNFPGLAKGLGWTANHTLEHGPLRLSIDRDGTPMDIEVPTYTLEEYIPMMQAHYMAKEKPAPYIVLDGDILCIHMNGIETADIPIVDYGKVIVDYRGYAGNVASGWPIFNRLLPKTVEIAHFTSPDPLYPGRFTMRGGDCLPGLSTKPDRKIVLVVDENTISNSEYLSMALQNNPNVCTIGSQTAGADGNVTSIVLPGAMSMGFTGIGVFYPDGGQTQQVGIRIDEIVHPTIESVRTGRDNVLDRAIEILK